MLAIAVVFSWPQIMAVCGVGEGVGVGVGVGLALAPDIQSVAARQAQTTAATLARASGWVFAVRLLPRIGTGL